eukprot:3810225-Rhodomonas_salina.1
MLVRVLLSAKCLGSSSHSALKIEKRGRLTMSAARTRSEFANRSLLVRISKCVLGKAIHSGPVDGRQLAELQCSARRDRSKRRSEL